MAKRKSPTTKSKKTKKRKAPKLTVEYLLKQNNFLQQVSTEHGKKVKCELTLHEFKPSIEAIQAHLKSKKFLKAKKKKDENWYEESIFEKYEPYIVQHKIVEKCLYCTLTRSKLNKIPAQIEKHINGKQYKKKLEELKEKEKLTAEKEKKRKEKKEERRRKWEEKQKNGETKNDEEMREQEQGSDESSEEEEEQSLMSEG
eukprot:augustus_masked-scaffold_8-processed-gene-12.2-mRNA-1 protein AED:0.40 eAED:0.62 QI:0/-1/0/1/-1/1/1/0/199